ncbi:MAG: CCA tRNA nucleotidyltransferase, partial [Candidatus Omnitrophica bacterium]|nr:CCA tRNA nucleotidyltransferase [Candidatus Omnitrophota bacterium]
MKIDLSRMDKKLYAVLKAAAINCGRLGLEAFIVGGTVRDLLLKRQNYDLDVVVVGETRSLIEALSGKFKVRPVLHNQFKTAAFSLGDRIRLDIVTARKEVYEYNGALPLVELGTLKDDLYRRDFTINAMSVSLRQENFGELFDYFGGYEDLKRGSIRVLHDKSYFDDPTRILRAIRFEKRLGFKISANDRLLITAALNSEAIEAVRPVRYFKEIKKILTEKEALFILRRL